MDSNLVALQEMATSLGRDQWRLVSDTAQVVANYLRCHPYVDEVRYPGLKSDPQFEEASHTLIGGFGPIVHYRIQGVWHELVCDETDAKALVMDLERTVRHSV